MRNLAAVFFLLIAIAANAQALRDINYNYLYNPEEAFAFEMKPVRGESDWSVIYKISLRDTSFHAEDFAIQWEVRQSLSEKESTSSVVVSMQERSRNKSGFSGIASLAVSQTPIILVARVTHNPSKRAWIFYKILESNFPVTRTLTVNNEVHTQPFVNIRDNVEVSGPGPKIVSYYNDDFPAAPPPFAEMQGKVSPAIISDSTFTLSSDQHLKFSLPGLYLIQSDTNSAEGITFRAEDDYPRLAKISTIAGPLMYICTRDELNRLAKAKNDKKAFDRIILSITSDTERARKLMRSYFRRVELANQFFTSYKEGWKTDRGMIYIIFGLPDEVFRFSDREVWSYNQPRLTFNFTRSASIFDPDNYVLIREKRYREKWLETVDLWRSARF